MNARAASLVAAAAVCIALIAAACASRESSQIPFAAAPRPPAGKALIYIFRSDAGAANYDVPEVRIDGNPAAALDASEYTAIHVAAGRHIATTGLDPARAGASARAFAFDVAPGQVAALALEFVGAPPQSTVTLPSKQGKMSMPSFESPAFAWTFVPDIESSALGAELRKRRYRTAESRELVPG